MQFDFLEAAGLPLTKTFTSTNGKLDEAPYPFAKYFTSHREEADDLPDLLAALERHAKQNHCLIKGLLNEELNSESRAGKTDPEALTRWVLLDLDFQAGWASVDNFIAELFPAWSNVSYIFQHSASAGVKNAPGLRGHVFIMLDEAVSPALLKEWLKERNLAIPQLRANASLSSNGQSLKWPLDISTCQSDKLIYIAPPVCKGDATDPLAGDRFRLVTKERATGVPPAVSQLPGSIDHQQHELVEEMRKNAGLPKRKAKFRDHGQHDILENPDVATVTGAKVVGEFMRLNLNGGDSWGYYFPLDNPTLLYNFKSEPVVRLRDIAPDYYRTYRQQQQREARGALTPHVFREPMRDTYYNVLHNTDTDLIDIMAPAGSKERLSDFMEQFGEVLPEPVLDWTVEFNPTRTDVIEPNKQWINLFKPTDLIRKVPQMPAYPAIPGQIDAILNSICVDNETKDYFVNWLAHLFQTRTRPETGWIFHGAQGTGKGALLNYVLRPLFGKQQVTEWTMQNFEEQFNAALEHTLILWLDEFCVNDARSPDQTMSKLKSYITEHEIAIRGMRANTIQAKNWLSVIIATNKQDPIHLPENDRRFNVAPPQQIPIVVPENLEEIVAGEIGAFASFLWNYKADVAKVRKNLRNEARLDMIEATVGTHDQFFTQITAGNLDWFLDMISTGNSTIPSLLGEQCNQILLRWCRTYHNDPKQPVRILRDELRALYETILGKSLSVAKFSKACRLHHCNIHQVRHDGRNVQGVDIYFKTDMKRIITFLKDAGETGLKSIEGGKT